MKKLFVVTSGDDSAYSIEGIFDTKELAKTFIEAFNTEGQWYEMQIEEWELNPSKRELQNGKKAFWVRMDIAGVVDKWEWSDTTYGFRGMQTSFTYDKLHMNCCCFAHDEKHAIKIANEKRVQHIALNTWGK